MSKGLPKEEKDKISQYVKNSKFLIKNLIKGIEDPIHDLAVELLRGLRSAYVLNNVGEVKRLKKETEDAIKAIRDYRGPESETAQDILVKQLAKLKHHDNIDTVVEGFVFQYDGQMYKFTGNFAPMNQLLGLFKYGRGKIPKMVKEAVSDLKEADNSKRIIAIYPGRFQPMGRHHAEVFKKIQNEYGKENTFISTTNKVELPKSPFNFSEKSMIIGAHGIDPSNVVMTKNPYYAREITDNYDPETTSVVYLVGAKDMAENPRFAKTEGTTKERLDWKIEVAPHVEIDIPDFGEMSGTTIRKALKDADEETFKDIMDFYDPEVYKMIKSKLSNIQTEGTRHFLGIFRGLVDEVLEETSKTAKKRVSEKIPILKDEGYPHKQAIAIAHSMEEKGDLKERSDDYSVVRDQVQAYFPTAKIHNIHLIGSTMRKKEWTPEQYEEFYGEGHEPNDVDLEVEISGISNEDTEAWAFSDEATELEKQYGYDVQLNIVEDLEETSMATGAVTGYSGKKRNPDEEEVNEALNYLLQKLGV